MRQTTLEEAGNMLASGDFRRIPLCREILSDFRTPVEALKILKGVSSHCFLLESMEDRERRGRYTFLGYDPVMELTGTDGSMTKKVRKPGQNCFEEKTFKTSDPKEEIRKVLKENRSPKAKGMPPFTGGLMGYFSFEFLKYSEPSLGADSGEKDFRDVDLMMFDKIIAFDHLRQVMSLMVNIPADPLEEEYRKGILLLDEMEHLMRNGTPVKDSSGRRLSEWIPRFQREEYCERVHCVKKYIRQGEVFQLVLANPMEAEFEGSLLDTYRVLRTTNPSPYMVYLSGEDLEVAAASPETLVRMTGEEVRTFPLAGTRPRGVTEDEDCRLEQELLGDEKELAEHNMLVDLGRNDLGKISCFGTVTVDKYLNVERFSHVMHLGSEVSGKRKPGVTAVDALDAVLPAGTLSGAPKIRACSIIREMEGKSRGIYGGAIGYLDFAGNMDTCIAIRMAVRKNGKVSVASGAGIVADSVPEKEYEECRNKAGAVLQAIARAEERRGEL